MNDKNWENRSTEWIKDMAGKFESPHEGQDDWVPREWMERGHKEKEPCYNLSERLVKQWRETHPEAISQAERIGDGDAAEGVAVCFCVIKACIGNALVNLNCCSDDYSLVRFQDEEIVINDKPLKSDGCKIEICSRLGIDEFYEDDTVFKFNLLFGELFEVLFDALKDKSVKDVVLR